MVNKQRRQVNGAGVNKFYPVLLFSLATGLKMLLTTKAQIQLYITGKHDLLLSCIETFTAFNADRRFLFYRTVQTADANVCWLIMKAVPV